MESINCQDFKPNTKFCPSMEHDHENNDNKLKEQQYDVTFNLDIDEHEPEQLGLDSCGCE